MRSNKISLPIFAIFSAAFIWGLSTPIAKAVITEIPPLTLGFFRFLLATVLFTALSMVFKYHTPVHKKDMPILITFALLSIPLNIGLGFLGIKYTTALDAITITALIPIILAVAGVFILGEKMSRLNIVGQAMALIGVLVVVSSPNGPTANRALGDVLLIFSSLSWVAGTILAKDLFTKYHSFTITGFMFVVGLIAFTPLALIEFVQNPNWIYHVSAMSWLGVVFLAVFTSVIAWLIFEWGLERSSATVAGVSTYLQLLVGAIAAAALLGELLSQGFVLGVALIILGVVLATRPVHHYRQSHHR